MYHHLSLIDGVEYFLYPAHSLCDVCNTGKAGGRYDAIALDDNDDVVELSLCVDCVLEVQ